jgi:hypothetical protein
MSEMRGQLETPEAVKAYLGADLGREAEFAASRTITLVSLASGARFTYRVRRAPGDGDTRPYFVGILSGADNESDYAFLGCLFPGPAGLNYRQTKGSKVGREAPSALAFAFFARHVLDNDHLPTSLEVWHEGRCGRCGRKLTVPESVATGFGPKCASLVGG